MRVNQCVRYEYKDLWYEGVIIRVNTIGSIKIKIIDTNHVVHLEMMEHGNSFTTISKDHCKYCKIIPYRFRPSKKVKNKPHRISRGVVGLNGKCLKIRQ